MPLQKNSGRKTTSAKKKKQPRRALILSFAEGMKDCTPYRLSEPFAKPTGKKSKTTLKLVKSCKASAYD